MLESNFLITKKMKKPIRFVTLLLPVICIVLLLSQTVFAKNTYLINDQGKVTLHTTYATDPAQVLDEVGVKLGEDDIFTTQPGLAVSEITVQRKQQITILYGGNTLEVTSYGETVEALLERLSLLLTAEDVVSVSLDTQTYDGMSITIAHAIEMEESYVTTLPFEITYCYDPTVAEGEERVLTAGVNGQALQTDKVTYLGGKEINRIAVSQTVLTEPVNAVIAVGTGENMKPHPQELPDNLVRPQFVGKPIIGDGYIITPEGERLTYTHVDTFKATAYNNLDPGCTEYNYIGTLCRVGAIAVDPTIIPYGTRMFIVTKDGKYVYGIATAEDCGSAIKGKRLDLYFETQDECFRFGIRDCKVYFLG